MYFISKSDLEEIDSDIKQIDHKKKKKGLLSLNIWSKI